MNVNLILSAAYTILHNVNIYGPGNIFNGEITVFMEFKFQKHTYFRWKRIMFKYYKIQDVSTI